MRIANTSIIKSVKMPKKHQSYRQRHLQCKKSPNKGTKSYTSKSFSLRK
jgi:hypothetical protein